MELCLTCEMEHLKIEKFQSNFQSREDWESFRIGVEGSSVLPTIQRNARHPGSPYFPVENLKPVKSENPGGQPSTAEEVDTSSIRYGGNNRRNEEKVDLKTKYFQVNKKIYFCKECKCVVFTIVYFALGPFHLRSQAFIVNPCFMLMIGCIISSTCVCFISRYSVFEG